jgi:hypothetical protein
MTFALITALQHSDHYTAPWYIAVPVIVVALGFTIWRRQRAGRGGAGRGPYAGSGGSGGQ